jgi:hypothetical protein
VAGQFLVVVSGRRLSQPRDVRISAPMPYTHLTIASEGRHPLCPEEGDKRALLRTIGRVAAGHVVLFALVDDHLHVVLAGTEMELLQLRRGLTLAVRAAVDTPVAPTFARTVKTRLHLENLVGYLLRQTSHHGLAGHPALTTGSCFPDLVGARAVSGLDLRLCVVLPRFRPEDAFTHVGLVAPLVPASDEVIRRAGVARVVAATTAAAASGPVLKGHSASEFVARRAAARLLSGAGFGADLLATELGIDPRSVRRLAVAPAPDTLIAAVRLRVALEDLVLASPLQTRAAS